MVIKVRIGALHLKSFSPIMARVEVSKEYVREQLHAMGVRDLSEQDLEAYTRDFTRLIQEHLQHDSSAGNSSGESFTSSYLSQVESGQEGLAEQTPQLPAHHIPHRQTHCAVFKTFPGDKENKVHRLPASVTPSPVRGPSSGHPGPTPGASGTGVRRKRKVLRKVNGESCVFDESYCSGASPSVVSVASSLSDLSLTSVSSSEPESPESGRPRSADRSPHPHTTKSQCKAFIRPATSQLYSRRLRRHDPVTRYHEWRQIWQNEKVPGEDNRSGLRWQIRKQMMHQDMPLFVPSRRVVKQNNYVVPTDKKRLSLRWEVRHRLAQQ